MKDSDLDKYKLAWNKEQSFTNKTLSETNIKNYLKKGSSDLTRSYKTGLIIDITIKVLLAISFISISFLLSNTKGILSVCIISGIVNITMVLFQISTYRKIPEQNEYSDNIRDFLKSKTGFYRERYFKSVYVSALSNPFILLSGMMLYFYFKHGVIRPLLFDDYLVFGFIAILGFVMGAFIQIKQYNFQIGQMETCLSDLDENGINEQYLKKQINQRKKMFIMFIIILVLGLLVLALIFLNNKT